MPVCGYVLIPEADRKVEVCDRLSGMEGCEVVPAANSDLLLLVTTTPDPSADRDLRDLLESVPGVDALLLTFGEIDPDTPQGDPVAEGRSDRPSQALSPRESS